MIQAPALAVCISSRETVARATEDRFSGAAVILQDFQQKSPSRQSTHEEVAQQEALNP